LISCKTKEKQIIHFGFVSHARKASIFSWLVRLILALIRGNLFGLSIFLFKQFPVPTKCIKKVLYDAKK